MFSAPIFASISASIFAVALLFITCAHGWAQDPALPLQPSDSLPQPLEGAAPRDESSALEGPIAYQAKDSMILDVDRQYVELFGDATTSYQEIQLEAAQIGMEWPTNTLTASYALDSAGKKIGIPVYTDEQERYIAQRMQYNFSSTRAIVRGIVTQQGEAYMHGEKVKLHPGNELHVRRAKYTTCNLENPHFHVGATNVKAVEGKEIISGPFILWFRSVPTPLGFFFGIFPQPKKERSGIIVPSYGEERNRGFFLRDGGYYFAINDYMDLNLTGDVYSKGSFGMRGDYSYVKRYAYSGSANVRHTSTLNDTEDAISSIKDVWVEWQHSPTARRSGRFSASVSGGTSTYGDNNLRDNIENNTRSEFSSSVSYSKRFRRSPVSLNTSLRHNQNVQTRRVSFTLPDIGVNMARIMPFQRFFPDAPQVLQRFSLSHQLSFRNEVSNMLPSGAIVPLTTERFFEEGRNGVRQRSTASTSFNIAKYLVMNANLSYTELWYFRELAHRYDLEADRVETDTLERFSRAGHYGASTGLSTRLYGTVSFGDKRIQAIRHVLNPGLSLSYRPDFGEERYGVHQQILRPNGRTLHVSRYDGFIFGTTPRGEQGSLGMNISNQFEMKVRNHADSTEAFKKISLLENLSMGSSYNFLADSFQLGNISLAARTSLFQRKIQVSVSSSINPYVWRLDSMVGERVYQRRLNTLQWSEGQGLGQFSSIGVSIGTNFRSRQGDKKDEKDNKDTKPPRQKTPYVPFDVSWSLNINYNLNYRKRGFEPSVITRSLTFNGRVSLTKKTKISFSSGYDFDNERFTQTYIRFERDLHCWSLAGSWIPFGHFTSYEFTLQVKASVLRSLKYNRRRSFLDAF